MCSRKSFDEFISKEYDAIKYNTKYWVNRQKIEITNDTVDDLFHKCLYKLILYFDKKESIDETQIKKIVYISMKNEILMFLKSKENRTSLYDIDKIYDFYIQEEEDEYVDDIKYFQIFNEIKKWIKENLTNDALIIFNLKHNERNIPIKKALEQSGLISESKTWGYWRVLLRETFRKIKNNFSEEWNGL